VNNRVQHASTLSNCSAKRPEGLSANTPSR
jgi:hypothetical protein